MAGVTPAPAPKPLSSPATVSVAIKFKSTAVAPILLGQSMGEFKKENLTVKIVPLLSADAIPRIAKGSIDITSGATDATFLNAVASGIDIRWNLGNYVPPDAGNVNVAKPASGLGKTSSRTRTIRTSRIWKARQSRARSGRAAASPTRSARQSPRPAATSPR